MMPVRLHVFFLFYIINYDILYPYNRDKYFESMNPHLIGLTLDTLGTVLIAFMALSVHHKFLNEHKVDENLFNTMRKEQVIGGLGVILLVIGYIIQISIY